MQSGFGNLLKRNRANEEDKQRRDKTIQMYLHYTIFMKESFPKNYPAWLNCGMNQERDKIN